MYVGNMPWCWAGVKVLRVAPGGAESVWGLFFFKLLFSKRLVVEAEGYNVWDRVGGQHKVGGLGIKMNLHTRSLSVCPSLAHPDVRLVLASSKNMWKYVSEGCGYDSLGIHCVGKEQRRAKGKNSKWICRKGQKGELLTKAPWD